MSVVQDSVFHEASSSSFKGPCAFLKLARKVSREEFRNTEASLGPGTGYQLTWSPLQVLVSKLVFQRVVSVRSTLRLRLSAEPPISMTLFSVKLRRRNSCPMVTITGASMLMFLSPDDLHISYIST